MKKLFGFCIFIGLLWFSTFAYKTFDASDTSTLRSQLKASEEKLALKIQLAESLNGEKIALAALLVEAGGVVPKDIKVPDSNEDKSD